MILRVALVSWAPGPRGDWVKWDLGTSHEMRVTALRNITGKTLAVKIFTCFGVQVTKVGIVASHAGKKMMTASTPQRSQVESRKTSFLSLPSNCQTSRSTKTYSTQSMGAWAEGLQGWKQMTAVLDPRVLFLGVAAGSGGQASSRWNVLVGL